MALIKVEKEDTSKVHNLEDLYLIPPFSILYRTDNRWKSRRANWKSIFPDNSEGRVTNRYNALPANVMMKGKKKLNTDDRVSIFDPFLCEVVYEWFSAKGDKILDPFAGHSSSFMPYLMKRKFIGFEITKERYDIQIEHLTKLREKYKIDNEIRLINDSSEFMYMYDIDKVDCIITDPPFWVAEKYEDPVGCGTQLSHIKDYNEFLESLNDILTKSISHLRNNGFLIIKVADVRKDRRFYDLTTDVINMLKNKITLVDKIVLELNPSKRHPLYIQAITNKNMLKVQEYCLVFRKEWLEDIEKDNDRINHNRIKVKDVYELTAGVNESELFWSSKRGKVDYITNSLKED